MLSATHVSESSVRLSVTPRRSSESIIFDLHSPMAANAATLQFGDFDCGVCYVELCMDGSFTVQSSFYVSKWR